jgi:hypothetical protein
MQTKLNIKSSLKAGLMAAIAAAIINVILFFIFHALGVITDDILVQPDQPLTFIPVIISSILPTLFASFVFFLIEKYSRNGFKSFRVVAIVLLLLSFMNPFMGIKGITIEYALALNLMHIVVVASLLFFIKREKQSAAALNFA